MRVTLYQDPLGVAVVSRVDVEDWRAHLELLAAAVAPNPLTWRLEDGEVRAWPTPGDVVTGIAIGVTVVSIGVAIYSHLTADSPVAPPLVDEVSPNNRLGTRANRSRPRARVPDIFGQLRATPDLVAIPYTTYEDHLQVQTSLLCVGRGEYFVDELREGDVAVDQLPGHGVAVYDPGTWPGNGTAALEVGPPPTDPPLKIFPVTAPSEELRPPNAVYLSGVGDVRFVYPNIIERHPNADQYQMDEMFPPGVEFELTRANIDSPSSGPIPLNGTYEVLSADSTSLEVDTGSNQAAWDRLLEFGSGMSPYESPLLGRITEEWSPTVFVPQQGDRVIASFVAPDGLHHRDAGDDLRVALEVDLEVELQPCEADGTPDGSPETFPVKLVGSATELGPRAVTWWINPTAGLGYYSIRARRLTDRDNTDDTWVDVVNWAEVYVAQEIDDFADDVTLIHARAKASERGTELKLTARVHRKLTPWNGATHTGTPNTTRSAAGAAAALFLDPYVGRLAEADADFVGLYAAEDEVAAHFGDAVVGRFDHTFDSENTGFEDCLATALAAGFLTARRDGPLTRFRADVPGPASLLLNRRCVVPGSTSMVTRFGVTEDGHDGVELSYVDQDTGEAVDVVVPPHDGVVYPRRVNVAGVTTRKQALYHAWRAWNKLRYVNETVSVTVTAEGQLAEPGDTVLLVDALRPGTRAGELVARDGATVTLDRDHSAVGLPATLWVQLADGTVDEVPVSGYDGAATTLEREPSGPTNVEAGSYARAAYALVAATETDRVRRFRVEERSPNGREWTLRLSREGFMPYAYDALVVWLPLHQPEDWGPNERPVTDGSTAYVPDATRGSDVRNGVGSPIVFTDGLTVPYAGGVTMACWVNADVSGTLYAGGGLALNVTDGVPDVGVFGQGSVTGTALTSEWTHVAFTMGDGSLRLYQAGVLVGEDAAALATTPSVSLLDVEGETSDLRVWHVALDERDVADLAAATSAPVLV